MTTAELLQKKIQEKKSSPVLIVDDDSKMLKALSSHLRDGGFEILEVSNPEEALEKLRLYNVSVIITYHKLNGTSGIEVLTKAKHFKPHTQRILIGSEMLEEHLILHIQPTHLLIHPLEARSIKQVVNDAFEKFWLHIECESMKSSLDTSDKALLSAKNYLERETSLGKKIHRSLLIDPPPETLPGIGVSVESVASSSLDADFVTFFHPAEYLIDFVIGDVSGKGLSSALVSSAIRGEIARFAEPYLERSLVYDHTRFWQDDLPSVKEVLVQLHKSYAERLVNLEYFVSLLYGRLNLDKRTLTFINCGFTKPLYFRHKVKKGIFLQSANFPLGTVLHHEYCSFDLGYEEKDLFIFYSDGIIEAKNEAGETFSEERLKSLVEEYFHLNSDHLAETIRKAVVNFTKREAGEDDFTLLVFKIEDLAEITKKTSKEAKLNSVLGQLEVVRQLTREACLKAPGDAERLSIEMQLAVDEIFTNIVTHGYERRSGFPVCIQFEHTKEELVVELSDQGRSFDPSSIPPVNLYGDKDHGYGWHLIRQIADRIVFTPKKTQNGWNHTRIYKRYFTKREHAMELIKEKEDGILIITLDSETLDAKQVPEFKEKAIKAFDEAGIDLVVFDLKKLQFIDSSGLGAFLSLMRELGKRGGQMSLAAMNKPVKTIFELVSMQKIFDCHDTVEKACQRLKNR